MICGGLLPALAGGAGKKEEAFNKSFRSDALLHQHCIASHRIERGLFLD